MQTIYLLFHSINASGILQFFARVYSLNDVGINMGLVKNRFLGRLGSGI